jgi:circadian clock protein KaiC
VPPGEIDPDELLGQLLGEIAAKRISRLVIDGIGELEQNIDSDRLGRLMAALTFKLRESGVTSVIVKEIPKVVGNDVDFSGTPLAVTAENLLLLRHVELDGKIRRLISVLKMRESGYDDSVREFEITPQGLRVLDPIKAIGALTGLPRQ